MDTASVEVLKVFDPPVPASALRSKMRDANFVRRNFQGTAFEVQSQAISQTIISLG
jgi:hypothetical protein